MLRHEPREVGRRAERAAVDLGQPEAGVGRGNHDVGVADQTDAAAEAEAVHRGDHRHLALVDRGEGGKTAAVRAEQSLEAGGPLHLLDVHAGVESAALGAQDHDPHVRILAERAHDFGQSEPALYVESVYRRMVDHDLRDAVLDFVSDAHRRLPFVSNRTCYTRANQGCDGRRKEAIDDSGFELAGKVVIVTGGTQGVGRGIAVRFLELGAQVVVCSRREPEQLPEAGGTSALFVATDVREIEQIDRAIEVTLERFGRLDVLVNNAGGSPPADAATASPRFSAAIVALNLLSPLNFSQRANAVMQRQESGGAIVNVASVSGVRPSPGTAAYGAAKAGLLNLTQTLAVEWAPKVRVNAVTAGLIRTEQAELHYGDEAGIARVSSTIPLGRMGEPGDVADACVFFASPLARYVSGANLLLHGGGERPAFLGAASGSLSG